MVKGVRRYKGEKKAIINFNFTTRGVTEMYPDEAGNRIVEYEVHDIMRRGIFHRWGEMIHEDNGGNEVIITCAIVEECGGEGACDIGKVRTIPAGEVTFARFEERKEKQKNVGNILSLQSKT